MNALLHLVFIGLGLVLMAFNRQSGAAMQRLNRVFWTEPTLELGMVYRVMIVVFGAVVAYLAFKD